MREGLKLSISVQGQTGSGRTYSSLKLLDGAREVLSPNDLIIYFNHGEGNQYKFYLKEFNNIEVVRIPYDCDLDKLSMYYKEYYQRNDIFAVIHDCWSRVWEKTSESAALAGGMFAKQGSSESGWEKYKRKYNNLLDYATHEGNCWYVAILLERPVSKPYSKVEDGQVRKKVKDLGSIEIAEKTSRSRFDVNLRTIVLTGKLRGSDDGSVYEELTDKETNKYAAGDEHIQAGYFRVMKEKGGTSNPFPLSSVAPRGLRSEKPLDREEGAMLAHWMMKLEGK